MAISSGFQDFRSKIEANPKLGIGLIFLILLVWVYGFLEIMDFSTDLEQERIIAQKKLNLVEDLAREQFWEERKLQSQELLKSLESKLWPIQNEGLVRANLQNELNQLAEKSGLERMRIQVDQNPVIDKNNPNFKRFTANLTATSVKPDAVENFLDALSHDEHHFILQTFELRVKPFPFMKVSLSVLMPSPENTAKKQGSTKGSKR